jgi:FkbM family methyltransferase
MGFIDREGNPANTDYEKEEQFLVRTYLPRDAQVLELGARYGTVSCVISEVLQDPTKHVAVEPDPSVIEALLHNREENGGKFHIFNGIVSEHGCELQFIDPKFDFHEYGTYTKPSETPNVKNKTLHDIEKMYDVKFDAVVADCEGFFYNFVKENVESLAKMRVLIYEQDGIPWSEMMKKYEELDHILEENGFKRVFTIPHPKYENNPHFHNVWVKTSEE